MFRQLFFLFSIVFLPYVLEAQSHLQKVRDTDADIPEWARMMYAEDPNYFEVLNAYQDYFDQHVFEKTVHTQYFKRWVNSVKSHVKEDGRIVWDAVEQKSLEVKQKQGDQQRLGGGNLWAYEGPIHHVVDDGTLTPGFRHSNVYCHDRSMVDPQVLFCGTESGGLYKTIDGGQHWTHATSNYIIGSVSAVKIKPDDINVVFMSAANDLWRSDDGGATWTVIGQPSFVSQNVSAWEFAFDPLNTNTLFAATNQGLFRSTNLGDNWIEVLPRNCETIAFKPNDPSVVYTIQYDNLVGYSRFYKSTDGGITFSLSVNGWFDSSMGDIAIEGGRLATTEADPNRIYAVLVGYQNAGSSVTTNGWVGTWVSYDAGDTWSLPHGSIGTPYTDTHPNLMNFQGDDGDYTQIHYNTTLIASQLDPDKILIGGLNLWISTDAATTYQGVGGYIGGIDYFHVDQQEYHIYKTSPTTEEIWFSNDGGIGFSNDFMQSHQNLNRGIQAVNLWGYDQGWSEDVMVGGRYHNGNMAYLENYPSGEFLALGGGEAPTGYVNYSDENATIHSDIGGYFLPEDLSGDPQYFAVGIQPNESYWNNGSSRIMFDHAYYNVAWAGKENSIYRSGDGAASFELAYTFGTNTDNDVLWIEQSYADHNYLYLQQAVGNTSVIWRSTDHGISWEQISLPSSLRYLSFTLGGANPNEIWVSYYDGTNGNKVFYSNDAGVNWQNWTTPVLNGEYVWAIAHQIGTNGGVYIALQNGLVYYRNLTHTDWQPYSSGLPASTEPLRIVPFQRQNVVRLATWNLGVWEAPAFEPSELIAEFAAESNNFFCPGNAVHFVDHSVCTQNATFQWSFPGATPASSTEQYPTVVYNATGTYDVTLTVTDGPNTSTITKTQYISSLEALDAFEAEDFETGGFDETWQLVGNNQWTVTGNASNEGIGAYSMRYDNYYYDALGDRDEVWMGKLNISLPVVEFDVAYQQYSATYVDSLALLYSLDCGDTWTQIWLKGGAELSTTASMGTDYFVPEATEWRHEQVLVNTSLSGEVIFAFQNRGHYGNVVYVDNINILEALSVEEGSGAFSSVLYPNPTQGECVMSVTGVLGGKASLSVFNVQGQLVMSEEMILRGTRLEKRIDTQQWANGVYMVHFTQGDKKEVLRLVVE